METFLATKHKTNQQKTASTTGSTTKNSKSAAWKKELEDAPSTTKSVAKQSKKQKQTNKTSTKRPKALGLGKKETPRHLFGSTAFVCTYAQTHSVSRRVGVLSSHASFFPFPGSQKLSLIAQDTLSLRSVHARVPCPLFPSCPGGNVLGSGCSDVRNTHAAHQPSTFRRALPRKKEDTEGSRGKKGTSGPPQQEGCVCFKDRKGACFHKIQVQQVSSCPRSKTP